jgi:hypothetical protein
MSLCVGGLHDLVHRLFLITDYRLLLLRDCGWREDMGEYLTSQLSLPGQIVTHTDSIFFSGRST